MRWSTKSPVFVREEYVMRASASASALALRASSKVHKSITSTTKMSMELCRTVTIDNALKPFDEMPRRTQIWHNSMLTHLVKSNQLQQARNLFLNMPERNATSYTLMITALSRSGLVAEASRVFDSIPVCHQNVISWTAMLSCYTHNRQPGHALNLFTHYFSVKVPPNSYTLSIILKACLDAHSLLTAMQIHGLVVKLFDEKGSKDNVFVHNSLLHLHTKLGSLQDAERIFNMLKWKDLCTLNIMMDAYARRMLADKAYAVFKSMPVKDTLSYNIVISGFTESHQAVKALEMFLQLLRSRSPNVKPNLSTYTIVLTLCADITMLELGMQMHAVLSKLGITHSNIYIGNSLINMYAKCGLMEEMKKIFEDVPMRDIVSWNTLIIGLSQNGLCREALDFAQQVLRLGIHNQNTFIGLLTSCSHGGLLDEGLHYFRFMTTKYGLEPHIEHYNCVIDMLGRAGRIIEAHDFLQKMPYTPNAVSWRALLNASMVHGNEEIGGIAASWLQILEPSNASSYVMLAKIYRCSDQVEKSSHILALMGKTGLKKEQGCSWISK